MNRQSPPVRLTLKELVAHFDAFVQSLAPANPATIGTYERSLRAFIAWSAVDGRFHFRPRDVERFRKYMVEKRRQSAASSATYMTALRRFCGYLVHAGVLETNPTSGIVTGEHHARHTRQSLTTDEVERLLLSVDRSTEPGARDFAIIQLMLGCGLTPGETCAADLRDLERGLDAARLILRGPAPGGKRSAVAVPQMVLNAVDEYLTIRFGSVPGRAPAATPLFVSAGNRSSGARLKLRTLHQALNRWLVASGVKAGRDYRLTPFSLRHTAGVRMAADGAGIDELMRNLRIETVATARLYLSEGDGQSPAASS